MRRFRKTSPHLATGKNPAAALDTGNAAQWPQCSAKNPALQSDTPSNHLLPDADPSPLIPGARFRTLSGTEGTPVPRRIVVHPGSGSESKNWPEPRWRELLERWSRAGEWLVDVVGGEVEGDRLERLALGLPNVRVLRNAPLVALAARISDARLFVGHDSGVSHLAAATGVLGLVLWGPTHEPTWRPRSDRFVSLRHANGLGGLTTDVVEARVRELMDS